jgi:hypothetical protein
LVQTTAQDRTTLDVEAAGQSGITGYVERLAYTKAALDVGITGELGVTVYLQCAKLRAAGFQLLCVGAA